LQQSKNCISPTRKCLNEAIIQGLSKIIFIHGVEQGILKSELIKELNKYQNIHYFDASMAKYGVGATEVYIGQNR
jgi:dsDNA-specific endonuclease/ATPase MutS2